MERTLNKRNSIINIASSFNPRKSRRRRKSGSIPLIRKNKTRSKNNKSADDIDNLVADDFTRHIRAQSRLRKAKRKNQKGNVFDFIQTLPRELQTEIYLKEREDNVRTQHLINPISRKEVEKYSVKRLVLPLEELMKFKELDEWVYGSALDVFINENEYHTFMFDTSEEDNRENIYHNNIVFATSYEEFVDKTRIEYSVTEDFVRYRVIPKHMKKLGRAFRLNYDGFFVMNYSRNNVLIDPDDWDHTDIGEEQLNTSLLFTDRIKTIMRTYFSNIANRRCGLYRSNTFTCIRLDTSHFFQEDFSHIYPDLMQEEDNLVDQGNCCVVSGGYL